MECKSIQISSSSSMTRKYDVFVSFRGEDVRNNFADHLFGAFQRKGIVAFWDDTNLKQGDHISTELMQAIEGSQVLIIVFSKNYATSSWCLQELAKIVDCMNMEVSTGQSVLPIFYDVSRSEVRKQSGDYGKALAGHEERFKQDLGMVQSWRKALEQVADLSGWDVQDKQVTFSMPQYKEIEKIVERVISILVYKLSSLNGLVGIHSRVQQLERLLDLHSNDDVRVIGICGMGGIGKTTFARAVFDRNLHQYNASCYIDDVSKVYHECGPIGAQKQLIYQTLNEKNQEIWNISQATYLIKTRLRCVKALIVLDNVDKAKQLEESGVNRECLYAGSKMIIISRDRHILNEYGMDEIYDVRLLNMDEAHQLFCRKAFKHDYIMSCDDISREYQELTDRALEYAQCLPLAIKVLGSFLYGRNISEWRSALTRLRDNPNKEIMDVLQISFDGLEPMEKKIFLDIACLFNHMPRAWVIRILDCCEFHGDIGIRVLIDKSLIRIEHDLIKMHDLLIELGKKIVQQIAPNEPRKWSRIWLHKDFRNLMCEKGAMDNIEVIMLPPIPKIEENTTLRAEVISKMNRLRVLIIYDGKFSGSLSCLSNELRYILWNNYPFTYFPSSCKLSKLVVLRLWYSNIKQLWEGQEPLDNLKMMDLSFSKNLVKTPDFRGTPNLVELYLRECTKLVDIHTSVGLQRYLAHLDLRNCTSLMSLPESIFGLSSLESLILSGCSKLFRNELLENAMYAEYLKEHGISDTAIHCQSTSSVFKRQKLMSLSNDICAPLMPSLLCFQHLAELGLSYCNLLNLPEAMASLHFLETLLLSGNNFVTIPCITKKLPLLQKLKLEHCRQLTSLSEFPLRTVSLVPENRDHLQYVECCIFNCPKFAEMESWSSVALSWMIQYLRVHKESSFPIAITFPGTRIPSWFNRRSVGGSIRIPFLDVHNSDWIGLAFCATFVAHYYPLHMKDANAIDCIGCSLKCETCRIYFGSCMVAEVIEQDVITAEFELVHLCLVYCTRQQVIDHLRKAEVEDLLHRLSFQLTPSGQTHVEARHYGMRTVFKHDLEELK